MQIQCSSDEPQPRQHTWKDKQCTNNGLPTKPIGPKWRGNPIPRASASEPSGARVSTTSLSSRGWSLPTVFYFFFVPLDQAPHHVLITLLHFLHLYSSLPSLFVSHGEWRYCFFIFNSFSLFLFTINLKKLLSRKNYKYSLDNFVSYKKVSKLFLLKFFYLLHKLY